MGRFLAAVAGGRLRRTAAVAVMLVVVLGVGGLVLALTPAPTRYVPAAVPQVTVPLGRLGDFVEYVQNSYYRETDSLGLDVTERAESNLAFRVVGLVQRPDNAGELRRGLHVDFDGHNVVGGSSSSSEIGREVFDLGTRELLLRERQGRSTSRGNLSDGVIGPAAYSTPTYNRPVEVRFRLGTSEFFTGQGRTLRLGEESNETLWLGTPPAGRSVVERLGRINGTDVIGLRYEVGDAGARYVYTLWFSGESAYPLVVQKVGQWWHNGTDYQARGWEWMNQTLRRVGGGTEPIPWDVSPRASGHLVVNPSLERSPVGEIAPADGTGSSLGFALSRAVAAVGVDPSLAGLAAWRASNAGSFLAGAALDPVPTEGQGAPPVPRWTLTFAAPGAATGYVVASVLPSGSSVPVNRDVGPKPLSTSTYDWRVPAGYVAGGGRLTLGQAERLWRATLEGEDVELGANYVRWGFAVLPSCAEPPWRAPDGRLVCYEGLGFHPDRVLGLLRFGHVAGVDTERPLPAVPSGVPSEARMNWVTMNASAGFLKSQWSERRFWDFEAWTEAALADGHVEERGGAAPLVVAGRSPLAPSVAVSTSLLVLLLTVYFLPFLKAWGARLLLHTPLFSHLRREKLLDNEFRASIHAAIRADPGVNVAEIHRRVGGGFTTIVYHLQVLEKNRVVSSLPDGRHRRFFPVGEVDHSRRAVFAVLQNGRTQQVYALIDQEPGLHPGLMARRIGISRPAVRWHLKRLQEVGLVGADREGRALRYFANPLPSSLAGPGPEVA